LIIRHLPLLAARIGLQSRRLDTGDRAGLILVGGVAGNLDCPGDVAAGVAISTPPGQDHRPPLAA
jgi:hypothetical protein